MRATWGFAWSSRPETAGSQRGRGRKGTYVCIHVYMYVPCTLCGYRVRMYVLCSYVKEDKRHGQRPRARVTPREALRGGKPVPLRYAGHAQRQQSIHTNEYMSSIEPSPIVPCARPTPPALKSPRSNSSSRPSTVQRPTRPNSKAMAPRPRGAPSRTPPFCSDVCALRAGVHGGKPTASSLNDADPASTKENIKKEPRLRLFALGRSGPRPRKEA